MAELTSHAPGTFSWPELATTDQKAGRRVLPRAVRLGRERAADGSGRDLFDVPDARQGTGRAAYTMRPDERQSGAPPHWNSYVTVANVDERAKKAQ